MRELLPLLPRPSRYAGIEDGACRKDAASVRLRVALAFPDTYEVGMSYLGQKILYGIVNAVDGWQAERVMAPDREAGALLKKNGVPLATLESDTPLSAVDCVAFSVTHELCYTNILQMLDLAGIPLRQAARGDGLFRAGASGPERGWPLVIAGGGAVLSAEPLAPFLDLMVLGDGEESLPDVLRLLEQARDAGWSRGDFLREARHIAGVYVPSFFVPAPGGNGQAATGPLQPLYADHSRPARRIVADLEAAPYPARQVAPLGAVHNRLALEIARGCTRGCRFCHAGMVYRPVRERRPETLNSLLDACLAQTGFDEISFLSLSTGDYSALKTLCRDALTRCAGEQVSLSLPSLRVGSIDDEIMERMAAVRRTGCTLAPEAGSQRLRDVINKGVSEADLLLHVQKLLEHGWRQVKLYFMIGLPTETDEDLAAIADLCRAVRDAAGPGGPRMQVTAALSPFVPKPFTPFQWEAQISLAEIDRRVRLVRGLFKGQKCLTLRWHEPAMSHLEGILSRADRRMADVVERAWRKGAIFCSWVEGFDLAPWLEALAECGISADECIAAREPGRPLPWSHLEAGIAEDFLLRERGRALAGKTTPDCRFGACGQCGACDTRAAPSRLARPAPPPGTNSTDGTDDTHSPDDADDTDAARGNGDARATADTGHRHRLVFARRDQEAHQPHRDEQGRIVLRPQKQTPPRLAPGLGHKAAQYRFWHAKAGASAALSQLELQAVLERALRRAGLPLAFSQGFHPLPLLSFGRALPVGVESRAEWFALTLRSIVPPAEAGRLLTPHLLPGLDLWAVEFTAGRKRTEQAVAETFSLRLPTPEENAALARRFEEFAALAAFPCVREGKNGPRELDLRPLLARWEPLAGEGGGVTFMLDWHMGYCSPLRFALGALAPLGDEEHLRARMRLVKTAQIFADGREISPGPQRHSPQEDCNGIRHALSR